jgi:hypothetical protein
LANEMFTSLGVVELLLFGAVFALWIQSYRIRGLVTFWISVRDSALKVHQSRISLPRALEHARKSLIVSVFTTSVFDNSKSNVLTEIE